MNAQKAIKAPPRSDTGRIKKGLLGLIALGVLATVAGSGTFASFNATITQNGNITTGVLVLGDKVDAQTECFSSAAATITTNVNTCALGAGLNIFNGGIGVGTTNIHQVAIRQVGDLAATHLYLSATACADAIAPVNGYSGGTPVCPVIQFMVAEVTNFAAGPLPVLNCNFGDNTKTFTATVTYTGCGMGGAFVLGGGAGFTGIHTTVAGNHTNDVDMGALSAGQTRNFYIAALLPDVANQNGQQGRAASTTFTWYAQ